MLSASCHAGHCCGRTVCPPLEAFMETYGTTKANSQEEALWHGPMSEVHGDFRNGYLSE